MAGQEHRRVRPGGGGGGYDQASGRPRGHLKRPFFACCLASLENRLDML